MAAYLTTNPPVRQQWYKARRLPLTGCTVLHGTESVFDEMGVDTGAENVARFIRDRTTPGSYHDLVDSDSWVRLVEYVHAAFHDGTGSNNWALALAFALRTVDWARMAPTKRKAMLAHGAAAFVEQQKWRKSVGAPLTRLRYISKAQSDAGESGFCCHGWRDPVRRSDPGTVSPHLFPFDEWLDACRTALAEHMPEHPDAPQSPQEDFMAALTESEQRELLEAARMWKRGGENFTYLRQVPARVWSERLQHTLDVPTPAGTVLVEARQIARRGEIAALALSGELREALAAEGATVTDEQLEGAIRRVLGSLDEPSPT
jgi:hypothetical protein